MLKLDSAKMAKAIQRAKTLHPRVRVISADDRVYSVTGSKGDAYTVKFVVVNGLKLAECDCKAGKAGQMCYHIPAAASLNIAVQSMRRQVASATSPAPKIARRVEYERTGAKYMAVYCDGWAI